MCGAVGLGASDATATDHDEADAHLPCDYCPSRQDSDPRHVGHDSLSTTMVFYCDCYSSLAGKEVQASCAYPIHLDADAEIDVDTDVELVCCWNRTYMSVIAIAIATAAVVDDGVVSKTEPIK